MQPLNKGVTAMLLQIVAYAFCIACAFGALWGFAAVAWYGLCHAAQMVQRTNVAAYTPNAVAIPHNQRGN
jgi:hypothetical protein